VPIHGRPPIARTNLQVLPDKVDCSHTFGLYCSRLMAADA
jgi:hypothetical protein